MISDNTISGNRYGIWMGSLAQATITGNVIRGNNGYGVAFWERPCFDTVLVFTGYVTGRGNTGGEHTEGDYCPETLALLFTKEDGKLDWRD